MTIHGSTLAGPGARNGVPIGYGYRRKGDPNWRPENVTFTPEPRPAIEPVREQCGTRAGWDMHYRRGEDKCDSCRAALSEYEAGRRAARKAARS